MILYKFLIIFNIIFVKFNFINGFITNANLVLHSEQKKYNEILNLQNLPCHLQTVRVKTFESAMEKIKRNENIENIYDLPDLIGFRFVFYTKDDLLKFYHHLRLEKTFTHSKNYLLNPKENGYKSWHIRYKNEYSECPIKQLECQLYIISDYYNALYGNARRKDKNYTLYF